MAAAVQPLNAGAALARQDAAARRGGLLRAVPALTIAIFLLPIAAGLIGTWLPAFGYLPALGGETLGLAPWRALLAAPGLGTSIRLTLTSGLVATAASLALVIGFVAAGHGTRLFARLRRGLAPILAVPHVAIAIGIAFLIAPSGWAARLVSPWATGWHLPPDYQLPLRQ